MIMPSFFSRNKQFLIGLFIGAALIWLILGRPFLDSVGVRRNEGKSFTSIDAGKVLAESANLLEDEKNSIRIFQQTAPSVAFIINKTLQRDIFSLDVTEIPQGSGTGFVWDNNGNVVTNYHVIANANALTVTFSDQSSFEAEVVGFDASKDIAVVRVKAPAGKLKPVPAGSSDQLIVGQKVLAIGNPFGLDQTLTVGIVSALGREMKSLSNRTIHDVIQTDAAINPGNSGGPLLDSNGRLIGVNTAIISPSGAYAGIGFAVPVNTVKRVVPQLIQYGKVIRPGLGINILPDSVAASLEIEGVIIRDVIKGGPADRAGLKGVDRNFLGQAKLGDTITGINGVTVTTTDELANELEKYAVGEEVTVEYLREQKKQTARVKLEQIN
jgi:S1-C subfamily serine protease